MLIIQGNVITSISAVLIRDIKFDLPKDVISVTSVSLV